MGIRGFKTYMLESYDWKRIGKDAPELSGPLVIDAMGICYCLYNGIDWNHDGIDWKHGGQYKELEQKCIDFVTNLRKSNVEPIFVFDGVDYKREKGPTLRRRKKDDVEKISSYLLTGRSTDCSCIPIFTRQVMSEAIREMKVPFVIADGDADSLTASIANYNGCPVLSNDSDFFIFNVEAGYIPFESFDWELQPITGKIYNWTDFASTFRDPNIIYLIPALASNDFISEGAQGINLASIYKGSSSSIFARRGSRNRISDLVKYIRSFSSVEEFFSSCSCNAESVTIIRENFHKAKEMYTIDKISMDDVMKSTVLETANGMPLPSWMLELYRTGCFSTSVLDPMILNECMLPTIIDNPKKDSSMKIGASLRRHLYGLLKPYLKEQKIKEGMRVGKDIRHISVGPIRSECPSPDPLDVLCDIFGVLPDELGRFENKWKLVALSLHYWSRNAEALTQRQIDILLFCFVIQSSDKGKGIIASHSRFQIDGRWTNHQLDNLHSFSMWQCVYYEAMKLNDALKRPLQFTSPAPLYNGRLCLNYACMKEADFNAIKEEKLTTFPDMARLYDELLSICSVSRNSSSKASKDKRKQPAAAAVKKTYSTPVSTANRFELLDLDSDDEDESDD